MDYKIAICDDSAADQKYIMKLTEHWAEKMQHTIQTDPFPSAESFLFHYAGHKDYDILLLDIEMGGMDGVSLAKKLRQDNEKIQIIFITGFPDFIAEGYEVSALHYLIKPVEEDTLAKTLDRAAANLKKADRALVFSANGETFRINVGEILYVEALAHFCRIKMPEEVFEIRQKFSELEKKLGEGFIRTHRSYLVRISCIKRISKIEIILDSGDRIPLSRSNYQAVNQAFIRYFRGEYCENNFS